MPAEERIRNERPSSTKNEKKSTRWRLRDPPSTPWWHSRRVLDQFSTALGLLVMLFIFLFAWWSSYKARLQQEQNAETN